MVEVIEAGLMELVDVEFAARVGVPAAEKVVEAMMVQAASDRFFQAEMRLIAPFAEVLMIALAVLKFPRLLKKIAPV